jgi:hypothetical protein
MNKHTPTFAVCRIGSPLLLFGLLFAAGCANPRSTSSSQVNREPAEIVITLDGDMRDWPGTTAATADEHHLYTRFMVEGETYTLQSDPAPTAIKLSQPANSQPWALTSSSSSPPRGATDNLAEASFSTR